MASRILQASREVGGEEACTESRACHWQGQLSAEWVQPWMRAVRQAAVLARTCRRRPSRGSPPPACCTAATQTRGTPGWPQSAWGWGGAAAVSCPAAAVWWQAAAAMVPNPRSDCAARGPTRQQPHNVDGLHDEHDGAPGDLEGRMAAALKGKEDDSGHHQRVCDGVAV